MGIFNFSKNIAKAALKTTLVPAIVIMEVASGNDFDTTARVIESASKNLVDGFENLLD